MTTLHRALTVVMLLTACAPSDGRFNPSHFALAGAGAPPDVVVPAGTKPGGTFGGIRTLGPSEEGFCCPAGPHLDVLVAKDHPATALVINVYVPNAPGDERFRVAFPDGSVRTAVASGHGFATTRLPLPRSLRPSVGRVRLRVDATHAPYALWSIYFE